MAWKEKVEGRNFRLHLLVGFHPGHQIDDEAARDLGFVVFKDVAAVRTQNSSAFHRIHGNHLEPRGMAWGQKKFNARKDFLIALDKDQTFRSFESGKKVIAHGIGIREEGRLLGHRVFDPEIELFLLNIEEGLGEKFDPAHMIKINVGDDHPS